MSATFQPEIGDSLSLRGREWLVQDIDAAEHPHVVLLACVSDDAQSETAEIILEPRDSARFIIGCEAHSAARRSHVGIAKTRRKQHSQPQQGRRPVHVD
jgi:hypothetical protein